MADHHSPIMYEAFYGLKQKPFNMTPDPEFLFFTEKHREAFAHLIYGINERRGFIVITGEVGAGKTTLCRALLSEFDEHTKIALVLNPFLSDIDLLRTINQELFIDAEGQTKKDLLDTLSKFLIDQHARGVNVVLVIDEAQNVPDETLEQIRIISNLETVKDKLIQIVLVGQPELREKLSSRRMRQLNQRVTVRYHLGTLSAQETAHYIMHRLKVAGATDSPHFTRDALDAIHRTTGGVPRRINALCDQALLIGYVREQTRIDRALVLSSRRELEGGRYMRQALEDQRGLLRAAWAVAATLAVAVLCGLAATQYANGRLALPAFDDRAGEVSTAAPAGRMAVFVDPMVAAAAPAAVTRSVVVADTPVPTALPTRTATPLCETATPPATFAPTASPTATGTATPTVEAVAVVPTMPSVPGCFDEAYVLRCESEEASRPAAMATVLWRHGLEVQALEAVVDASPGLSESALLAVAHRVGLATVSVALTPAKLRRLGLPAVLELAGKQAPRRYIACWPEDGALVLGDPLEGLRPFDPVLLDRSWYGRALLFCPAEAVYETPLGVGVVGERVREVQARLHALGLYEGPFHGHYSFALERAVQVFQQQHFLQVDGIVGRETGLFLYAAGYAEAREALQP